MHVQSLLRGSLTLKNLKSKSYLTLCTVVFGKYCISIANWILMNLFKRLIKSIVCVYLPNKKESNSNNLQFLTSQKGVNSIFVHYNGFISSQVMLKTYYHCSSKVFRLKQFKDHFQRKRVWTRILVSRILNVLQDVETIKYVVYFKMIVQYIIVEAFLSHTICDQYLSLCLE